MAQEYAKSFYKSSKWKAVRDSYYGKVGGLCEDCLAKGIYEPAVIVHHKEQITQLNITNPEITLSYSNLKAVCRKCHAAEHGEMYDEIFGRKKIKRFSVSATGEVVFNHEA